jgi:hypothetical protein
MYVCIGTVVEIDKLLLHFKIRPGYILHLVIACVGSGFRLEDEAWPLFMYVSPSPSFSFLGRNWEKSQKSEN